MEVLGINSSLTLRSQLNEHTSFYLSLEPQKDNLSVVNCVSVVERVTRFFCIHCYLIGLSSRPLSSSQEIIIKGLIEQLDPTRWSCLYLTRARRIGSKYTCP